MKDNNLVIIDADSIVYIVGYELAEMRLEPLGLIKLDSFIRDILIATESRDYLGFFGGGGVNYRNAIAVTKEYKGNRKKEKEEWYEYWEPILKKRMKEFWGFQQCGNIEADDACAIAVEKYRDEYPKITIASPDKDLYQIPECWFFDYYKRTSLYCNRTVSLHKLCIQIIQGDNTDNIPGLYGAGKVVAEKIVAVIAEKGFKYDKAMEYLKEYYVKWNTVILKEKQAKKQEKIFLDKWKLDNDISRFTKQSKSDALAKFRVNTSMLLDKVGALKLFNEQCQLLMLLTTEEEGKKHGFTMIEPVVDDKVDWDTIEIYAAGQEEIADEDDFEFIDDL